MIGMLLFFVFSQLLVEANSTISVLRDQLGSVSESQVMSSRLEDTTAQIQVIHRFLLISRSITVTS